MKKLYIICLILFPLVMVSCKDDSGDFIEQYYTDAQLTSSLRTCLTAAKDTALNRICVPDGLNGSENYRIILPDNSEFRALADALAAQGKSDLADSIVCQLNRACEQSGNALSSTFNTSIASLTFPNPSSIVYTSTRNAATTYFKTQCGPSVQASATSIVAEQMQYTGAAATWAEMQSTYHTAYNTFLNYDITSYSVTSLLTAIYTEMEKEEELIRTDTTHASADNLSVFRN